MTRDDIINMGYEADAYANEEWDVEAPSRDWKRLRDEHFAALVAAAEREACALICEEISDQNCGHIELDAAADIIRARGQP